MTGSNATRPPPSGGKSVQEVVEAFNERVAPPPVPLLYHAGLFVVAVTMVLLPALYIAMIVLVGWGTFAYVRHIVPGLPAPRGLWDFWATVLMAAGPPAAGGILLLFMVKPLFAPRPKEPDVVPADRERDRWLFALAVRVAKALGAPAARKIELSCEVNASASLGRGLLGFLGRRLVLRVGLPLLAGLDLGQLTAILAHEMGHFSQRTATRFLVVIWWVSTWFERVVYERDAWDERLQEYSREGDRRIILPLLLARLFIWITRKILWVLMWIGEIISCAMIRQKEYDADRCGARVAGSKAFIQALRRLELLDVANHWTDSDVSRAWQERRLYDNLPALVLANLKQIPAESRTKVLREAENETAGLFSTHPGYAQRVRRIHAEAAEGIFRSELPAACLLGDFDETAKAVTLAYYHTVLGAGVREAALVPTESLLTQTEARQAAGKAFERYSQGLFSPAFPPTLETWVPAEPPDVEAAAQEILRARTWLDRHIPELRKAAARVAELDARCVDRCRLDAVLSAGLRVRAGDLYNAKEAVTGDNPRRELETLASRLEPLRRSCQKRLRAALSLVYTTRLDDAFPDIGRLRAHTRRMYGAASTVSRNLDLVRRLEERCTSLRALLRHLDEWETEEKLRIRTGSLVRALATERRQLGESLAGQAYPFDHARKDATIADYAVPELSVDEDPTAETYEACRQTTTNVYRLYYRLLSGLASVAERVESSLGLEVLPDPPDEQRESDDGQRADAGKGAERSAQSPNESE